MQHLKIALVQTEVNWHNVDQNLIQLTRKIEGISEAVDLIILPEMFTTGFSMQPQEIAESMEGVTLKWMQKTAALKNSALCGSVIIEEDNKYYNRLLFVHPDGRVESYDKKHLFTLAGEHQIYSAGTKKLLVSYKDWKISPLICYDLRFPVWSRNTENYDLIIYVANWPKPRIDAWDTLLKARAVENMSYSIGVNRVGIDGNDLKYNGHSSGYDCLGAPITSLLEDQEGIILMTLDKNHVTKVREKLNFLEDRDPFKLQ
jgi:predicted amidohydrolase